MKIRLMTVVSAIAISATPGAVSSRPPLGQLSVIANPVRPKADSDRDVSQKAVEMLELTKVRAGQSVAELVPGGGYWTRLFSVAVGPTGKVYAALPPAAPDAAAATVPAARKIAADPNYANVTALDVDFATFRLPEQVDLVWTSKNFRDFYQGGRASAQSVAKAVFENVKPGGYFVVLDHAASAAMPIDQQIKLGRIDPAVVKADVIQAGFKFVGESKVLANPADDHLKIIIDPSIVGHTDQFAYKFRKPK